MPGEISDTMCKELGYSAGEILEFPDDGTYEQVVGAVEGKNACRGGERRLRKCENLEYINAASLKFLSIEGLYKAMGYENRNSTYPQFTDHCFTGDYPIEPTDANNKHLIKDEMSLMSTNQ